MQTINANRFEVPPKCEYTAPMPTASDPSPAGRREMIEVAGRKTEVLRGGDGPPLLYLHSAAGEMDWSELHRQLARRHEVIAAAHPGFSYSDGLATIRDITDYAWHTVDLLDSLGLSDPLPLVGFSLGAWIAAETAILRPGRVSHLVLTCAAGLRLEDAPYGDLFQDDLDRLRELLFHPGTPDDIVEQAMPLSMQDNRIVQWLKAREATARVGWNPYLHNPRLRAHLHRIAAPTLVLWADGDRLIPPAHADAWAEAIPGASKQIIAGAGHMLPFEQPAAWADAVTAFLD